MHTLCMKVSVAQAPFSHIVDGLPVPAVEEPQTVRDQQGLDQQQPERDHTQC